MQIDLTLTSPEAGSDGALRADLDVRIEANSAPVLSAVRSELCALGALPAGTPLHGDGRPLDPHQRLGSAGLRTGSLISADPGAGGPPAAAALQVLGGPSAGDVHPLRRGEFVIGRDPDCAIVLRDDRASRRHALLTIGTGSVSIRDLGSTNGTSVDGAPVPGTGHELRPGVVVRLGDSLLCVAHPAVVPASVRERDGALLVNRPPRPVVSAADDVIDLPAIPQAGRPRPVQWLAALLPAAASAAIAWATGSVVFLAFGLLSPVLLVSTALGDRMHWRRSHRRAASASRHARRRALAAVSEALSAETGRRRERFPDPPTLALIATLPGARLWERRADDGDALRARVGSAGLPAGTLVRTAGESSSAGLLADVPVVVELARGPVGLAGGGDAARGVARWLLAQLAALHPPGELDLAIIADARSSPSWSWARWLPHLQGRAATTAPGRLAAVAELRSEVERRLRLRSPGAAWPGPWTVAVVDAADGLAGLETVLCDGPAVGVSAVVLGSGAETLPAACRTVVTVSGSHALVHGGPDDGVVVGADTVTVGWAETIARAIAPLALEDDRRRPLPDECGLLEVLGIDELDAARLARSWKGDDGRADTVLGRGADGPLTLDLAADGPHALIAGTTGSGKSSLLQSLVAGLCLRHPPTALSVLLIDFKGGAAFGACAALPHCAGLVTDLDPHLTERALSSLEAELRRRERLLGAAGAADLDAYRDLAPGGVRDPLPRLVIVVDEFAALAEELPDFVPGLVGVANRGRSLGIHLVLATQRPGSVVSADIRANTSLRIALRVTDPAESSDVVGVGDAAALSPATPGRAYVRTASGLQCVQTARSDGPAARRPDEVRVTRLDPWRRPVRDAAVDTTALADLVSTVRAAAELAGLGPAPSPWLAPLPRRLSFDSLPAGAFGLSDRPADQSQVPMSLDLTRGAAVSTLVLGGPGSGRTTTVAAIALCAARARTPDQLELHAIDPLGGLVALIGRLPHLGTCVGPGSGELVDTLLERLASGPGGTDGRAALLLIDAWETVLAAQDDAGAERSRRRLDALLRTPAGVGVIVAGDRTLTVPRFSGAFTERLALRFADRTDYGALGIPARAVPAVLPPGRGLHSADGSMFQIGVPGPVHVEVAVAVRAAAEQLARSAPARSGPPAMRLVALPRRVALADLPARRHPHGRLRVGLAGEDAATVTLDPFTGSRRWVVTGPPRSGRSTVLVTLFSEAAAAGLTVVVAAPPRSPLAACARGSSVPAVGPGDRFPAELPRAPTLVLVDDGDSFADTETGETLLRWARDPSAPVSIVLSTRSDELAVAYRGLTAELRRARTGIVLQPGPVDGELFGVRLPRAGPGSPPGRGYLVPDPAWSPSGAAALPVQIAEPPEPMTISPCGGSDDPCPTRTSP